jgi:hypothetical protein
MTQTTVSIPTEEIHGKGSQLWALIFVDEDDAEDTNLELWRADDEEDLYQQYKSSWDEENEDDEDDEEESDDFFMQRLDDDWGYKILPKLIGKISHP